MKKAAKLAAFFMAMYFTSQPILIAVHEIDF